EGLRIVVRTMAGVAGALGVDGHRGRVALGRVVAAHAGPGVGRLALVQREGVALAAIGGGGGAELLPRLLDGVIDLRLARVAAGTSRRARLVDLGAGHVVALRAGD